MKSQHQHIDDAGLTQLLYENEDSDMLREIAAHVDTCDECEQRLSKLAASDKFASEAISMLSDYPLDDPSHGGWIDETPQVGFLAPPSHPEMLGRLGRYEIERVVGAGGMGVVLRGFDSELNRPVAIKVLAQHLAHRGAARRRFAREAKAAAAVVHEHVVAIHNVETDGDPPFLVMQFIAGESLQARVDREGPLDTKEVLRIGIQAAAGLAAAHEQGVIHRDIKPANILLEDGVERVLITDFGLARTVDDATLTHTGIVAGTPHYMSPEQANGQATDERTDLFSLGSVLYFMVTGRPPFRAERAMGVLNRICHHTHRPAWQVNSEVPDELSDLIDRLLQKKPSQRFASATAVRETLSRLLTQSQQRSRSRRTGFGSRLRRNRALALMLFGGAVAVVFTIAALSFTSLTQDLDVDASTTRPSDETENAASRAETMIDPTIGSDAISAEMGDVEQRISAFESASASSEFARGSTDDFARQVESMNQSLDQIEHFPISQQSESAQ